MWRRLARLAVIPIGRLALSYEAQLRVGTPVVIRPVDNASKAVAWWNCVSFVAYLRSQRKGVRYHKLSFVVWSRMLLSDVAERVLASWHRPQSVPGPDVI